MCAIKNYKFRAYSLCIVFINPSRLSALRPYPLIALVSLFGESESPQIKSSSGPFITRLSRASFCNPKDAHVIGHVFSATHVPLYIIFYPSRNTVNKGLNVCSQELQILGILAEHFVSAFTVRVEFVLRPDIV